jgi:hypothetical protein
MSASATTATAISAGTDWRELAVREGDGIEVRLLWSKSADRVKVTVADSKFDEEFELDAAGDALAASNHPFPYAPSQRRSPHPARLGASDHGVRRASTAAGLGRHRGARLTGRTGILCPADLP